MSVIVNMTDEEDGSIRRPKLLKTGTGVIASEVVPQVARTNRGMKTEKHGRGNGNGNAGGPPADGKNICLKSAVLPGKDKARSSEFVFEEDRNRLKTRGAFEFTIEQARIRYQ